MKWLVSCLILCAWLPSWASQDTRVWSLVAFERQHFPSEYLKSIEHMIEGGTPQRTHVYVPQEALDEIERWNVAYELIAPDVRSLRPATGQKDIGGDYHRPETMRDAIESMVELYPDLVRLSVIGYSVDNRPIDAIVISDNVSDYELNEPCMRMVGAYHGDEWASVEVVIATAWALLGRYAEDDSIKRLVNGHELWLIPMLNPDGVLDFERRNRNGVDLNRNFSWAFERTPQSGEHAFSEPETLALYDLSMNRAFHHNLSVHSGASNFGWVWNYQTEVSLDEDWFREVGERYLETTSMPDFWITNGAQWYMVNGEATDWLYGVRGGHDYTLEVSVDKAPPVQFIPDLVQSHIESVLDFYQTPGLRGRVVDPLGQGMEALVTVSDLGAAMMSDPQTGTFFRPTGPSAGEVIVSAPGFESQQIDVELGEFLEVTLAPSVNIVIESHGGLTRDASSEYRGWLESAQLVALLESGAQLALYRIGLGEPQPLEFEIKGDVVSFELYGLQRVKRESRGFWDLVVIDAEAEALARYPWAVFFADDHEVTESPPELVSLGDGRYLLGEHFSVEPTEISFLGPNLARRVISKRVGYERGYFEFEVDTASWVDGDWVLRITQGGRYKSIVPVLRKDGDKLSWVVEPERQFEGDETDIDSQSGCTCQTTGRLEWFVLVSWALIRMIRRRPRVLLDKAR